MKNTIRRILNKYGYEIVKLSDHISIVSKDSWLLQLGIRTIIDIGSNEGQFINKICRVLPMRKIYAFEPIKYCYERLLINTQGYNITAYNYAVGNINSYAEINVSNNYVSSSILDMEEIHLAMYPNSNYVKKEAIRIVRLDDILKEEKLEKNILVKIDVQGFEEKVLKGGVNTLSGATAIIIETAMKPLYEGEWRFHEVYKYFIDKGFVFMGFFDQILMKTTGIPLYADAIFIQKNMVDKVY